ncbi:hypothetical protein OHS59_31785 [Streptomyces sp. NBC_00414]|uniref:hypothetical protein n=1 Tax=Streptomyces sp. NBC_00414 TaxID=2975739 RepID=UPI002E224C64
MKRYELVVDIYKYVFDGQNEAGGFLFHYEYENPVTTKATGGSIKPFDSLESFGAIYKEQQMVELYMPYRPSLRDKLGRIRNKTGEVQFVEPDNDSMEFEIFGIFPQVDMNGRTVDYRVICKRSVRQN